MRAFRIAFAGASVALMVASGCTSGDGGTTNAQPGGGSAPDTSDGGERDTPGGQQSHGGTTSPTAGKGNPGGDATGGAPTQGACVEDDECPAIETHPADCAEAHCMDGSCRYVARDADGDGFPAKRCQSSTMGVSVERGEDCDDTLDYVNPNGWDGPAGDGFSDGCNDQIDQDCSALIDDGVLSDNSTCMCKPGEARPCSTYPTGQPITFDLLDENDKPLGACRLGSQECLPNGTYGACTGAVAPALEACAGADWDCDGVPSKEDESAVDRVDFVCDQDKDNHLVSGAVKIRACAEPDTGCENGRWIRNPSDGVFDDCDDLDDKRYLFNQETCDGKDNDCDQVVDDHGVDALLWSYDGDGDSYRDATFPVVQQCGAPTEAPTGCVGACPPNAWHGGGAPLPLGDCDDNNPAKNPSAKDPCNGVDMDCDGSVLSGCACSNNQTQPCGTHPGKDGKGICSAGTEKCSGGNWGGCIGSVGWEAEVCGVADRDCDGIAGNVDTDAVDRPTWACDGDLDGHLAPGTMTYTSCAAPNLTCAGTWIKDPNPKLFDDCDDTDGLIHPGASERCNRLDDDCSTSVGQTTPSVVAAEDGDLDKHTYVNYADCSGGYPVDDCDDKNDAVHPGQGTRFTTPYGCGNRTACYQADTGLYKCIANGNCSGLPPVTGPFYASFDYNCNNKDDKPQAGSQLFCAKVQNACTDYNSYWATPETGTCGQPSAYKSCELKPATLPNQLPQCGFVDKMLPLPCR